MPEQALYLKWRPTAFDEMVGQEHIIRTLKNSLKTGRIRHAYLFSGPRGTGKTTSARLLAKAVNCTHPDPDARPCNQCAACVAINEGRFLDLIEIDAASHTGVDDVRDLREKIAFTPSEGRYKVYIIDEVHRFSGNAFDALLKTLEEPPDHALFVLATTEIDKVPATIKSRCLPFEFRRLTVQEVADRLALIAAQEGIQVERAALELIAREGTGSVRDSISLLDQVVADPSEVVTLELAQRILGTASTRAVRDLVEALINREVARGVHLINDAIDSGSDPRQFGQQVVEQLRLILLAQTAGADMLTLSADERAHVAALGERISRSELLRAIRAFYQTTEAFHSSWQPQLALELAFLEALTAPEAQQQAAAAPMFDARPASSAPPAAAAPAPALTGRPGLIPASVVAQKWSDAQRLIYNNIPQAKPEQKKHVQNLPSLMSHVHVRAVDGDVVILGTQKIYAELLGNQTCVEWIERALLRVTGQPLRIKVIMDEGHSSDTHYMTPSPDATSDPVSQMIQARGGVLLHEEVLDNQADNDSKE
ncbi:DNA polymerase III subunit gamma/tau [Aggregatilineales bacterium SYSU G02658]